MYNHPDIHYALARLDIEEALARANRERRADQARHAPNFVPANRWRDPATWTAIIGPLVGIGFLSYFAQEVARATIA